MLWGGSLAHQATDSWKEILSLLPQGLKTKGTSRVDVWFALLLVLRSFHHAIAAQSHTRSPLDSPHTTNTTQPPQPPQPPSPQICPYLPSSPRPAARDPSGNPHLGGTQRFSRGTRCCAQGRSQTLWGERRERERETIGFLIWDREDT